MASTPANGTQDTPLVALAPQEPSLSSPSPQPNDRLQPPQPEIPTPSASQSQVPTLVGSVVGLSVSEQEASTVPPAPTPTAASQDAPKALASPDEAPSAPSDEAAPEPSQAPLSKPESTSPPAIPQTPQIYLTFLLLSGHRRTLNFDPHTGIGRVKEVVWGGWSGGDWPAEDRPPAPSYLRVLHAGRMLQDDETLSNLKLPVYTPPAVSSSPQDAQHSPTATIMHISVRPFGNGMEELDMGGGTWKTAGRGRRGRNQVMGTVAADGAPLDEPSSGCCGCIIC